MDTALRVRTSRLRELSTNAEQTAQVAHLKYVSDTDTGITREKRGDTFVYLLGDAEVKDEETLFRISRLVIPPAWTNVWICTHENGHLQATGFDTRGRKQYRYHPVWNALRSYTKFSHLYDFGLALPAIRRQVQKDLALKGMPPQKVLAAIVYIMQHTNIRIGNNAYEKLYGSFGLTTLKNKHVSVNGTEMKFAFKGKKGVYHDIKLRSQRLANIIRQCREIPGKELFQYYDEQGGRHPVDSGMVNEYLRNISDASFTSKDFRTWSGSMCALGAFNEMGSAASEAEAKRKIATALDDVAKKLGNTRNVCRKYYVHPAIIDHYTNNTLSKYYTRLETTPPIHDNDTLCTEEQVLLLMLADMKSAVIAA